MTPDERRALEVLLALAAESQAAAAATTGVMRIWHSLLGIAACERGKALIARIEKRGAVTKQDEAWGN